jgi:hypothetical protein
MKRESWSRRIDRKGSIRPWENALHEEKGSMLRAGRGEGSASCDDAISCPGATRPDLRDTSANLDSIFIP